MENPYLYKVKKGKMITFAQKLIGLCKKFAACHFILITNMTTTEKHQLNIDFCKVMKRNEAVFIDSLSDDN